MGLAEVLAAKRAAAEKQATPTIAVPKDLPPGNYTAQVAETAEGKLQVVNAQPVAPQAEVVAGSKPLTFAEKMALKKQQEAQQKPVVQTTPASVPLQTVVAAQKEAVAQQAAAPAEEMSMEDTAIRQAYAEIAQKIDELASFSTEDLAGAMSSLKKALMQNPAACELMLDEDIGKMVIALRRVTNTTIAEAKEGKTKTAKTPKIKDMKDMSADEIMDAWAEI